MIAKTKTVSGIASIEKWLNVLCEGMQVSSHQVVSLDYDQYLISVIGENMKEEKPKVQIPMNNPGNPSSEPETIKDNRIKDTQPKPDSRQTPDAQKKNQKHIR
jgi:hypothetical protein